MEGGSDLSIVFLDVAAYAAPTIIWPEGCPTCSGAGAYCKGTLREDGLDHSISRVSGRQRGACFGREVNQIDELR